MKPPQSPRDARDALLHFLGRLVGEGEGQDALGGHPLGGHEVRDAYGEHLGLATASAGNDHRRPVGVLGRCALGGIEAVKIVHAACRGSRGTGVSRHLLISSFSAWRSVQLRGWQGVPLRPGTMMLGRLLLMLVWIAQLHFFTGNK